MQNISDAERVHLEELTRRIVNKLLHDPITMLRRSEGLHGTTSQYLHAMERLFHLNDANPTDEEGGDDDSADGEADVEQERYGPPDSFGTNGWLLAMARSV